MDNTSETRTRLREALADNLANASAVVVSPVVDGLTVDLEVDDITPFTRHSFEPYVHEQVLGQVAPTCVTPRGVPLDYKLLLARFSP